MLKKEKSCGGIVVRDHQVLLIKSIFGHWGFPKGHVEPGETETKTAIREIKEETNLDCIINSNYRFTISFNPKPGVIKEVVFFEAIPLNDQIINQEKEVSEAKWLSFEEAYHTITYQNEKELLLDFLSKCYFSFDQVIDRANTNSIKWDLFNKVLPFWVADSDYPTDPLIIKTLKERINHPLFGYTYIGSQTYQAVSDWYQNNFDLGINHHQIIFTAGVVSSIRDLLRCYHDPKQPVIIQTPGYHGFPKAIIASGNTYVENKLTEQGKIDFKDLENLFKSGLKTLILCSPHNPLGKIHSYSSLVKLVKLAVKYQVLIISDEIHSDIIMPGHHFVSVLHVLRELKLNNEAKVIVVNAPSKTFNIAGMYGSYLIVTNSELNQQIKKDKQVYLWEEPTILSVEAITAAYQYGYIWKETQNWYLFQNYLMLKQFFKRHLGQCKVHELEATYLVWVELTDLSITEEELIKRLEAAAIKVEIGTKFNSSYNFIRINIACSRIVLEEGLHRIQRALTNK